MSPPRVIAGAYRQLLGSNIELALGNPAVDIAPATDVLLGLARLTSTSVDSLFGCASKRLQLIPDVRTRILLWDAYGTRTEQAAAKRLAALADTLPRRPAITIRRGEEGASDWTSSYLAREWEPQIPAENVRPAVEQSVLILLGDRPLTAVSQAWQVAQKTGIKAPNRVVGAHHLLAFMARHRWGISADEAWADAIALLGLIPPVPFFGRSIQAGPVSDEIRAAMFGYMAGANNGEF